MNRNHIAIVLILVIAASAGAYYIISIDRSPETATITGKVTDLESGKSIGGAEISIGDKIVITAPDGSYELTLDSGCFELTAIALGYDEMILTVNATEEETDTLNISLEPTGDVAVRLGSNSIHDDQNPAFSPNGRWLLFSSKRNGDGQNLNLWITDADGRNPVPLTDHLEANNVNMPGSSWNAAKDRICFSSDRTGNDEIWMMNPDGSDPVQLTNNPARDWEPTFSPDGGWIVFQSNREGPWEIYKMNLETRETTRLTNNAADDWEPNWSPTGDKIAFQSN